MIPIIHTEPLQNNLFLNQPSDFCGPAFCWSSYVYLLLGFHNVRHCGLSWLLCTQVHWMAFYLKLVTYHDIQLELNQKRFQQHLRFLDHVLCDMAYNNVKLLHNFILRCNKYNVWFILVIKTKDLLFLQQCSRSFRSSGLSYCVDW